MKNLIPALICLFLAISSQAEIITVDDDGPADFNNIQDAIDNSNNGDEIVVAEATYVENINFNGKNIILRSTDPNDSAVVAATVIDGNDANSVVTFSGTEDSNCVLTGFTITGGKKGMPLYVDIQDIFGDVEPNWIGWDDDEFPISLSTDFDDNFSATLEYGLLLDNGDWQTEYPPGPDIADVLEDGYRRFQDGDIITLTFSGLKAGDYFIVTYHVDMDNTSGTEGIFKVFVDGEVFTDSVATVGRGSDLPHEGCIGFGFTSDGVNDVVIEFDGEAVEPDVDEVWLNGFSLEGKGALRSGGGIAGNGCSVTISKCVITDNWAQEGGGVYDCDGLIKNNVIFDNVAEDIVLPGVIGCCVAPGGGLSDCDGTIAGNMISGNYAFSGGGLDSCGGTVINNLLVDNLAVHGGAFYDCDGAIINCTVVGHSLDGLEDCNGTISNCIIWHNLNQLDDCNVPSYSCIEDWVGGGIGNISTDPCFADPCNGDYHLQSVSPCIDAGDPNYVQGPNETDLDGKPRVVVDVIDMGAYESQPVIELSATEFEFIANEGGANPAEQILTIRNAGGTTLNWTISYDCNWLEVDPNSGSSTGEPNEVTLSVDTTGLEEGYGTYECDMNVSDPNAENSPQSVIVTVLEDCYTGQPDYAVWVAVGRPECWCYPRQCRGDADGLYEGGSATGYYYVGYGDLNVLTTVWKVLEDCAEMWPGQPSKCEQWPGGLPTPSGPGITSVTGPNGEAGACADFTHEWEGGTVIGYYYVGYNDLNVLTANWKVLEDCAAMWPGEPAKCEQWPGGPNTPGGPGIPADCEPGNIPVAEPSIAYEITPCDMGLSATEQSGQTRFTVTVEERYIHFEDMMVANCCPEELGLEMTVEDNLITIYETEYTPGGCYCICDYPVTATLGPFNPGTYTLEVYEDYGGFIGSTIVSIE